MTGHLRQFVVDRDGVSSVAQIRRLKQAEFRIENIMWAYGQQIKELRERSLMKERIPELWVRGPARAFHRYRILPETVEEIANAVKPLENLPVKVPPYVAGLPGTQVLPYSLPQPEPSEGMCETSSRTGTLGPG